MQTIAKRYLSYPEAVEYSGLSEASLRRLVRAKLLRAARPVPNRVLIDREELDRYLRECSVPA